MLSEQAQAVLTIMQQRPWWVVRVDQQYGYTFGLGQADRYGALVGLPSAVFDELLAAGLIQRLKVYQMDDGRFTLCTYQTVQH
jgi:hypothetical protein